METQTGRLSMNRAAQILKLARGLLLELTHRVHQIILASNCSSERVP